MVKQLKDYFIGTEGKRFYKWERSFYDGFITKDHEHKNMVSSSKAREVAYLLVGKYAVNVATGVAIYNLIATHKEDFILLGVASEAIRYIFNELRKKDIKKFYKYKKRTLSKLRKNKDFRNTNKRLETIINTFSDYELED